MQLEDLVARRTDAAREFDEHEQCQDGNRVTSSLTSGLSTLRNLFFIRVHEDVDEKIGTDSMLMAGSPIQRETEVKVEIEIFQIAESAIYSETQGYISDAPWYAEWLSRLRLGKHAAEAGIQKRLARYLSSDPDARRQRFSRVLEKGCPQARRAPLVLYQLFPLSVHIATAVAFGNHLDAGEVRNVQMRWLPSIGDCHECHGRPLDNVDQCRVCSNPLWSYRWLTTVD